MSTPSYQKNALIFACNYYGANRLYGCINDANKIKQFLLEHRGFAPSNIKTVYDSAMTYKGMWKALEEFTAQTHAVAAQGKIPASFLYYSGHGVAIPSKDGEERQDQCLVPYDFANGKLLIDDDLLKNFIQKLHPSTQLFLFTDCCYSGSNFDLPYGGHGQKFRATPIPAQVIGLSGCQDDQTSAEIQGAGVATNQFVQVVGNRTPTVARLQSAMNDVSLGNHRQNPQVSTSSAELMDGNLFDWLVQDEGSVQSAKSELKKATKRAKQQLFWQRLFQEVQRFLTGAK